MTLQSFLDSKCWRVYTCKYVCLYVSIVLLVCKFSTTNILQENEIQQHILTNTYIYTILHMYMIHLTEVQCKCSHFVQQQKHTHTYKTTNIKLYIYKHKRVNVFIKIYKLLNIYIYI